MNKEDRFSINDLASIRAFCMNSDKEDVYRYIYSLQQENKMLREKFKATNKGLIKVLSKRLKWKRRYYKEKYIRKELKKWLEQILNELKENDIYDRTSYEIGQIVVIESIIAKIEELEEGVKDE